VKVRTLQCSGAGGRRRLRRTLQTGRWGCGGAGTRSRAAGGASPRRRCRCRPNHILTWRRPGSPPSAARGVRALLLLLLLFSSSSSSSFSFSSSVDVPLPAGAGAVGTDGRAALRERLLRAIIFRQEAQPSPAQILARLRAYRTRRCRRAYDSHILNYCWRACRRHCRGMCHALLLLPARLLALASCCSSVLLAGFKGKTRPSSFYSVVGGPSLLTPRAFFRAALSGCADAAGGSAVMVTIAASAATAASECRLNQHASSQS
jgi:hypothetical protein